MEKSLRYQTQTKMLDTVSQAAVNEIKSVMRPRVEKRLRTTKLTERQCRQRGRVGWSVVHDRHDCSFKPHDGSLVFLRRALDGNFLSFAALLWISGFQLGFRQKLHKFYFIIKLNAVFGIRQLNYCTGVPRATKMFPWGSAPGKGWKPLL